MLSHLRDGAVALFSSVTEATLERKIFSIPQCAIFENSSTRREVLRPLMDDVRTPKEALMPALSNQMLQREWRNASSSKFHISFNFFPVVIFVTFT